MKENKNMKKIIYHGSERIIKTPIYGLGKKYNDYGLGFYCTESKEMAKEWGVSINKNGFANCYEIDCEDLRILNLNDKEYCILHWLAILLENRMFDIPSVLAREAKMFLMNSYRIDYYDYDVIIGYRADDSYFSFAQDFLNGSISVRQLNNAMHLGKLGEQFVIKSKEAFDRIHFIDYEIADYKEWFLKKERRDREARREYFDLERNKRIRGDLFITQIIDEEIMADDARLR